MTCKCNSIIGKTKSLWIEICFKWYIYKYIYIKHFYGGEGPQWEGPIGSKSTLYLKLKLTARSRGLPEIGPTAFAKPALSVLWKQRYPNFLIFFVFIHNMIISKIYKLFNLHFALLQPENDNPIDYYCNFHYFFIDKWWERIDIWFKIHMW